MNEELNEEISFLLNKMGGIVVDKIVQALPKDTEYSEFNLLMNVLTCSLGFVMQSIPSEHRKGFIYGVANVLEINRQHFEDEET